jgi:hypothetical protein
MRGTRHPSTNNATASWLAFLPPVRTKSPGSHSNASHNLSIVPRAIFPIKPCCFAWIEPHSFLLILSQSMQQQLASHYGQFPGSDPEDLLLKLINDTQLLAWPSFRQAVTEGKAVDEEAYLDKASRYFASPSFADNWLPLLLQAQAA